MNCYLSLWEYLNILCGCVWYKLGVQCDSYCLLSEFWYNLGIQISNSSPNSNNVPSESFSFLHLCTLQEREIKIFWNYNRQLKGSWIINGLALEKMAGFSKWGFTSPKTETTLKTRCYIWGLNIQNSNTYSVFTKASFCWDESYDLPWPIFFCLSFTPSMFY